MPPFMRTWLTRRTQAKFTVSVTGFVTNDKNEVLLLNHVLRPKSGWGLPGGFIDEGEQPAAAVKRELLEETGLALREISLYRVRTLKGHIEILFLAKSTGEAEVKSVEITELGWFSAETIPAEMNLDQQFLIKRILEGEDK